MISSFQQQTLPDVNPLLMTPHQLINRLFPLEDILQAGMATMEGMCVSWVGVGADTCF